jgi:type II secretory pathway component GspD/PulD (secretin)
MRGGGRQSDSAATSGGAQRARKVTASADEQTNTVVVSAASDVLDVIDSVIRELDANPTAEQDVFIYRLKNAQAANLETVLNDLFADQSTTRNRGSNARGSNQRGGRGNAGRQQASTTATRAPTDLAGQVLVVADEDTNSLMVMTASKNFERIRDIIADLDKPVPQVLIKVLIAEVTHADRVDLGFEFSVLNLRASGLGQSLFTDFGLAERWPHNQASRG